MPRPALAQVYPIQSDVALQPAPGQSIERLQIRWSEAEIDGTTPETDVDTLEIRSTTVYANSPRYSTLVSAPLVDREVDGPPGTSRDDFGLGDITLLGRYQLWRSPGQQQFASWTALGGIEMPTHDGPLSSHSWDPIVGTVYTWRRERLGFDADVVYQVNTKGDRDVEQGDLLRYDVAVQYRLWPPAFQANTGWSLTGLLELNGEVQDDTKADGRTLANTDREILFLSPGAVITTRRGWFEAGVQLPISSDVGRAAAEDDFRVVFGFTTTF